MAKSDIKCLWDSDGLWWDCLSSKSSRSKSLIIGSVIECRCSQTSKRPSSNNYINVLSQTTCYVHINMSIHRRWSKVGSICLKNTTLGDGQLHANFSLSKSGLLYQLLTLHHLWSSILRCLIILSASIQHELLSWMDDNIPTPKHI